MRMKFISCRLQGKPSSESVSISVGVRMGGYEVRVEGFGSSMFRELQLEVEQLLVVSLMVGGLPYKLEKEEVEEQPPPPMSSSLSRSS